MPFAIFGRGFDAVVCILSDLRGNVLFRRGINDSWINPSEAA